MKLAQQILGLTEDFYEEADARGLSVYGPYKEGLPSSPEQVRKEIERLVQEYGETPYDINNGQCDTFANTLADRLSGAYVIEDFDTEYPNHMWVYVGDMHYDAEAEGGVSDWEELPIFKKYRERRK